MRRLLDAGGATTALIAALCLAGCYEATPFRVSAQTPGPIADCARVADGVFYEAAFQRVRNVVGPDLFYTPRVTPVGVTNPPALGWGIGVWIKGRNGTATAGPCDFELENLQAGPMCSAVQCVYAPQRGAEFDQALKSFAQRLAIATP